MRRYKPDIIVLLTVLVGIGILATTVAQAAVTGDGAVAVPARVTIRDNGPIGVDRCYLCRIFGELTAPGPFVPPQAVSATGPRGFFADQIPEFGRQDHNPDSGIGYRFPMVTTAGDGGVDLTLRLANHRTPAALLDPYVSFSLSGHW